MTKQIIMVRRQIRKVPTKLLVLPSASVGTNASGEIIDFR
jgi:hypothetical protein